MSDRSLIVNTIPDHGMKTEEFAQAQAAASRVFGRDKNTGIIFEGDTAYVRKDGTIVYPALNDGQQMSKNEVLVARGFADHETSHKRYTDMGIVEKFMRHCQDTDNPLLRAVANAVDDTRVDKLAIRDYSGAKTNIEATAEAVLQEYLEFAEKNPDDAKNMEVVLPLMITVEGRKRMGFEIPSANKVLDTLNAENRKMVDKLTGIALQCTNPDKEKGTQEVINVAKLIIEAKAEGDKEAAPEPKKGGKSDGRGSGDGEGGKDAATFTQPEESEIVSPDLADSLRVDSMKKIFEKGTKSDKRHYRPFSTEFDVYVRHDTSEYVGRKTSIERYENTVHSMHGKISTMSRKLERALLATQRRDWMTNTEAGSLDPKRLVQASMGKPNVFRMREDRREVDTAVSVLIDLSGSMAGEACRLAAQVAIALSLVFEKVGVAYEVLGWNNKYLTSGSAQRDHSQRCRTVRNDPAKYGKFSRFDPMVIYEFKSFDKRLVQERKGLSTIDRCVGGNNSDVDAVKVSHSHLRARMESRKILFVLSDGFPACSNSYGCEHQNQHLRNEIERVVKNGIDCVGLGIMSEAVKQFYPRYVVIHELEDLPKAAFDQIAKLLVNERYKVDNADLMRTTHAR